MDSSKEAALNDLPKEELVKRCKKYLLLAQKAKLAKDESTAELKQCKEIVNSLKADVDSVNAKLSSEILSHQSLIETYDKEKNELEKSTLSKIEENKALKIAFDNLNNKGSEFEILISTGKEKLNEVCVINEKLTQDLNSSDAKNLELSEKLKNVESKYSIVETKLVEFQDKYLEEKQKHSKLEARLLKLEERSEKSSSERSESRDGLQTVAEVQDLEAACQKMDEAVESNEKNKTRIEELLTQNDLLKQELLISENSLKQIQILHNNTIDNCVEQCSALHTLCLKAITENMDNNKTECDCKKELVSADNLLIELKEAKEKINNLTINNKKFEEVSQLNRNLNEKIKELTLALESCNQELSEYKDNKLIDSKTIETLKEEIINLKKVRDSNQMEEVLKSQSIIENLNDQLKALQNEHLSADNKFADLQAKFEESTLVSANLEALVRQRCEEYGNHKVKVEAFDRLVPQFERLGKDVSNASVAVKKLREDASLELNNVKQEHQKMNSKVLKVVEDFLTQLADGNSELLSEMNMMNQVLKNRGETISKLEESRDSLRADVSDSENKIKKLNEKMSSSQEETSLLLKQVETRDQTIHDMEEEIWKLRNPDAPADTLSSSTISRMDESQRLAELEETFEDRYSKLKTHAVKLKKKVVELQGQLDQEHAKLMGERAENQAKLASFKAQTEAMNTLQTNYEVLQDASDAARRESAELRKSLNKSRSEGVTLHQTLNEVKSAAKLEDAKYEIIKKELSDQIKALKKAVDVEKSKSKEWIVDKGKWEQERKGLEKKLEVEKEKYQAMVTRLEEERLKQKKQSLLSLEMADCERSVTEISRKLDAKESQIQKLTASLETQRELSGTLQATLLDLESRVTAEQATADSAKAREVAMQDEVFSLRSELGNKAARIEEIDRLAQTRALELDELVLESSTTAAEFAKMEEKLRVAQESARTEIMHREEKLSQLKELHERKELELSELRKEFESYKVRAQSVLRQSQRDAPPGRQQDIEEEAILLRASSQTLRTKLDETTKRLQQLTEDHTSLVEEKTRLSKKVQELQNDILQLNKSNSELQVAEQRTRETGEENCRLLKVQQDTLAQCYKKEMEELESKYIVELESAKIAQQQAETALQLHVGRQVSPSHRRQPSSGNADLTHKRQQSGGGAEAPHRRQPSTGFVPVKTERETLDVFMLEREACEGSESVDSSSPRVVPLEQLLAPQSSIVPAVDVSQLMDKLEKCESRIHHLTNLLSDAESDAARLQQLNQVLKEEIRRKERNVAREEHSNNLEYLKNVVVKFATLPRGDERLRLVPVLNTILKFSRDEEQRLCASSRADGGPAGWGNYLGGVTGMWANNQ